MERQKVNGMTDWTVTGQAYPMRFEYVAVILLLGLSLCCPKIAHGQVQPVVQGIFGSNTGPQYLNPGHQPNFASTVTPLINPCTSDNNYRGSDCAWPIASGQWPLPQLSFYVEQPYNTTAYNVSWYLATSYTDPCWLKGTAVRGCPDGATPYNIGFSGSTTGDQQWQPVLHLYGSELAGHITVQALVKQANSCSNGVTSKLTFDVWGVNQDPQAQLKYAVQNVNNSYLQGAGWFLPYMIGRESPGGLQFIAGQSTNPSNGHPVWGKPDGIGVIQVDRVKNPTFFALNENPYWNFIDNLEDGALTLLALQQYNGPSCNTPALEVTQSRCMSSAYDFWDRQVFQACLDNHGSSTPLQSGGYGTEYCNVPIPAAPANPPYANCSFSYPQTTANHYRDAEWIQTYNGACLYYIIWQRATNTHPGQWVINETQTCTGSPTHYVKDVCTATSPY